MIGSIVPQKGYLILIDLGYNKNEKIILEKNMNGKGSSRRPKLVSQEVFEKNWERIFGSKKKNNNKNHKNSYKPTPK